jgi:hypothetical protein
MLKLSHCTITELQNKSFSQRYISRKFAGKTEINVYPYHLQLFNFNNIYLYNAVSVKSNSALQNYKYNKNNK